MDTGSGRRSILYFIEPVTYRSAPLLLRPWMEWIAAIIMGDADRRTPTQHIVMSSPWLCRALEAECHTDNFSTIPIEPRSVLRPFGMDRHAYAQDLARSSAEPILNHPLFKALEWTIAERMPDLVLSLTQNRYISMLCPSTTRLFMEVWPLQRLSATPGFFLDPFGHQAESALVQLAQAIKETGLPRPAADIVGLCDAVFARNAFDFDEQKEFRSWLNQAAGESPVALFALQPPDWPTFEGAYDRVSLDTLLMRWLDALPPGWKAIATHHRVFSPPREVEESIAEQFPQFLVLPEQWRVGRSEQIAPFIEGIVTISSSVGITGLLMGKRVVSVGTSSLNGLCGSDISKLGRTPPLTMSERAALFVFLTNRYCHRSEDVLQNSAIIETLQAGIQRCGDQQYYLDYSSWSLEKAKSLMSYDTDTTPQPISTEN